jgi:hypothetical protein
MVVDNRAAQQSRKNTRSGSFPHNSPVLCRLRTAQQLGPRALRGLLTHTLIQFVDLRAQLVIQVLQLGAPICSMWP